MSDAKEVIYCRYGQCADRTVPCPSCVTLVVGEEKEAPMMESWQKRVIEEKADLDIKIDRLKKAIETFELTPLQRDLMNRQLWAMTAYSTTLRERIANF